MGVCFANSLFLCYSVTMNNQGGKDNGKINYAWL